MSSRRSTQGFTLLEILVVITLIIIIVGIALPRFTGVSDEGRRAKASAELKTLQTALESYLLKTSPTLPAAGNGNTSDIESALEGASPRLVGEVSDFIDPFTASSRYLYKIDGNSRYYVIHSVGPDRTADVTGISTAGAITPTDPDDDIYATNGQLAS
jgi:general secretion pathway protein G